MAGRQTYDIFMSKLSFWKAYKIGSLGVKFGSKTNSHQLIIQEVFHYFSNFQVNNKPILKEMSREKSK